MCKIPLTINYDSSSPIKSATGVYRKQGESNTIGFTIDNISSPTIADISENGDYELIEVKLTNDKDEVETWTGVLAFTVGRCLTEIRLYQSDGDCGTLQPDRRPAYIDGTIEVGATLFEDAEGKTPLSVGYYRMEEGTDENPQISVNQIEIIADGQVKAISPCAQAQGIWFFDENECDRPLDKEKARQVYIKESQIAMGITIFDDTEKTRPFDPSATDGIYSYCLDINAEPLIPIGIVTLNGGGIVEDLTICSNSQAK